MLQTEKKTIDKGEYEFRKMGATTGVRNLIRLGKVIGEPLVKLIATTEDFSLASLLEADVPPAAIASSVSALVQTLDESETLAIIRDLTNGIRCDGMEVQFDSHFAGRYRHLLNVLASLIRFNYADFFDSSLSELGPKAMIEAGRAEVQAAVASKR